MGTEGNELSNRFRGPNYAEVDFGITKTTAITEHTNFEFRTECYNLFNRVNLTGMVSDQSQSTFGMATSQLAPRWLQFSGKLSF
jgi:hypothetical protein